MLGTASFIRDKKTTMGLTMSWDSNRFGSLPRAAQAEVCHHVSCATRCDARMRVRVRVTASTTKNTSSILHLTFTGSVANEVKCDPFHRRRPTISNIMVDLGYTL